MWMHQFDECNDTKARNRLSLSDRVRAIEAYEKIPVYQKIGLMFNCSAKQIRNIIRNKKKILSLHNAGETRMKKGLYKEAEIEKRRAKKISLLGKVMHEWFLRARRNPSIGAITYKLLQTVALEVKELLQVENFHPNNAWLINFRLSYNVSDIDMKASLADEPGPTSLDVKEILEYVQENNASNNQNYSHEWLESIPDCNDSIASSSHHMSNSVATSCSSESQESTDDVVEDAAADDDQPPSKIPKLEPIDVIEVDSDDDDELTNGHRRSSKSFTLTTISQALQHLKPLEDFALMMEDYRAIGLISQLEIILKQKPK